MEEFKDKVDRLFTALLGYTPEVQIADLEEELSLELEIDPQDSGLLIGYHGEVLSSIQLYLNLVYYQLDLPSKPVRLNINNYRQQRQQSLEHLAENTAQKALERQTPIPIYHLSSYERRLIHMYLQEREDVTTYSEGESPHRVIMVSPV